MRPKVRPCTGGLCIPCGRFVPRGVPAPQSHCVCWGFRASRSLSMHWEAPCTSLPLRVPGGPGTPQPAVPANQSRSPSCRNPRTPRPLCALWSPDTPESLRAPGNSVRLTATSYIPSPSTPEPVPAPGAAPRSPGPVRASGDAVHHAAAPCIRGSLHPGVAPCTPSSVRGLGRGLCTPELLRAP